MFRNSLKIYHLLAAIALSSVSATGQSASAVEGEIKEDSLKVIRLNKKAWSLRNSKPDSTLYLAKQALQLSRKYEWKRQEILSLNYLGIAERNKSNYSKAFSYYMQALTISELVGELEQKGYSYINIGNLYIYQSNFEEALQYFYKALDVADALDDEMMRGYCYLNIGRTCRSMKKYDLAEQTLLQSLEIRRKLDQKSLVIDVKVDLGELFRLQGNLDKSLQYFKASLDEINEVKNFSALSNSLNNIGLIYREKDSLELAEFYAQGALEIAHEIKSKLDIQRAMENLAGIYEDQRDYKKAYEFLKKNHAIEDSIFNEEHTRNIERLLAKHESEKIESEAKYLRGQDELNQSIIKRQSIIIILSVITITLLGSIFLITLRAFRTRNRLNTEIMAQKNKIEKDKETIERQSKRLTELDAAKSRFFANISHDLRSPLSLILGNIENIFQDDDNYLTPPSKENLEVGYKNGKRLLFLADEINELTKLEEGKLPVKHQNVEIKSYLLLLVRMFSSAAEYKSIELKTETDLADNTILSVDPAHFEKIIYNLISNAINHTPQKGAVTVKASKKGEYISIVIEDNGEGIPSQSIPYIFDRYYQSPSNAHKIKEGLGIGLALVKELVDLHDGKITVNSVPEKGTSFEILLPFKAMDTDEVAVPTYSDYIQERNNLWSELMKKNDLQSQNINHIKLAQLEKDKDYTILLVDDHPEVREYIKNLLVSHYTILEATNGQEALNVLQKENVDLVVTDLMMPWMDGFELLEKMQENSVLKKIPALVVSARTNEEDKQKVLFRGINDILYKPFDRNELLLRINNLISNKNDWADSGKLIISNTETMDDLEKGLIEKIESLIIEHINDPHLSVAHLSDAMAASERKVYRMIKKLTGFTPLEYIKEVRWKYLEVLIREKNIKNPTEAAKSIGNQNVTKFKQQFERKYGKKIDHVLDYGLE